MAEKSSKRYPDVPTLSPSPFVCNGTLRDATLMLLGKSGVGKSSLGNIILNLERQDGFTVTVGCAATEMYEAVVKTATVNGRTIRVVDTPGVMDTNFEKEGNEEKVMKGICDGIACCPDGVDAFLIVLRIDVRFTPEEFEAISKLERLFGSKFWCYVIMVFTHGDEIDNDPKAFKDCLRESREKINALHTLMSKLHTEPLLADAGRRKKPDIVGCQMKSLRFTVDQLMWDNKQTKYTNELFLLAQAVFAQTRNADLEKKHRVSSLEMQLLKEKVSQLEEKIQSEQENTRGLWVQLQKTKEMLLTAQTQVLSFEAEFKKFRVEAAKKMKERISKPCNLM